MTWTGTLILFPCIFLILTDVVRLLSKKAIQIYISTGGVWENPFSHPHQWLYDHWDLSQSGRHKVNLTIHTFQCFLFFIFATKMFFSVNSLFISFAQFSFELSLFKNHFKLFSVYYLWQRMLKCKL
jgi:hypothetical protein